MGQTQFNPKQLTLKLKVQPITSYNNPALNRVADEDQPIHNWYRFVLSFPPHLVRRYIRDFGLNPGSTVLDPFCGTGTTLVEARLNSVSSIGLEANPFPAYASRVKLDWSVDPVGLLQVARSIAGRVQYELKDQGIVDEETYDGESERLEKLNPDLSKLLLKNSISPAPLHKTLVLMRQIEEFADNPTFHHLRLALAKALVSKISNLRFGPEVGVGMVKKDVPVLSAWMDSVTSISNDLSLLPKDDLPPATVHREDARQVSSLLPANSIDAIICSPPYPNEKDYTRTTRLESVLLGFIDSKLSLQESKRSLIRSNTRGVYKGDSDDDWIRDHPRILRLAEQIENRRVTLNKTSGFERLYGRVTKLYFGGMARHLRDVTRVLKPGAHLAYVVGDQASYLRVLIRTGELLGEIASKLGYDVKRIDLFRTRFATATSQQLREEVVVLQWPG